MKVITLHPDAFERACRRLADDVRPFAPQLIIGILHGGGEVGRRVARCFPEAEYVEVETHRPGKSRKASLKGLLRHMPAFLADMLRRIEMRRVQNRQPEERTVELPGDLAAILEKMPERRILIVDDAVDSGATLKAVVGAVRRAAPQAGVRSAVLTVTAQNPVEKPDYALWRDGSLIRFPWSFDYSPRRK